MSGARQAHRTLETNEPQVVRLKRSRARLAETEDPMECDLRHNFCRPVSDTADRVPDSMCSNHAEHYMVARGLSGTNVEGGARVESPFKAPAINHHSEVP